MPTYTFEDKETGERIDKVLRISQLDQFKKDNPNLEQVILPIGFSAGSVKPDDGFRDILREIKNKHPNSTVDTF